LKVIGGSHPKNIATPVAKNTNIINDFGKVIFSMALFYFLSHVVKL
jgi:hypothetical protein